MDTQIFSERDGRDLIATARALFPHAGLPDGPYQRSVAALLATAGTSPALFHAVHDGLRDLRTEAEGDLAALSEESLRSLLAEHQSSAFFGAVRQSIAWVLYDDREVWEFIGYPGPSFELGGYLERGFNDLSWLPEPRITESELPMNEIGPLRAGEGQTR